MGVGGRLSTLRAAAHLTPQISLIRFTLYSFGRHGSLALPLNMASLRFSLSSSSSPFLMYVRQPRLYLVAPAYRILAEVEAVEILD